MSSSPDVVLVSKTNILETKTTLQQEAGSSIVYEVVSGVSPPVRRMGFITSNPDPDGSQPRVGVYKIGELLPNGKVERARGQVYSEQVGGAVNGSEGAAFFPRSSDLTVSHGDTQVVVGRIERRVVSQEELPKKLRPQLKHLISRIR